MAARTDKASNTSCAIESEVRREGTPGTELAAALRLFASIFEQEVNEAFLREIQARLPELSDTLGNDPLSGLDLTRRSSALENLSTEFCRLFIGPHGHLPPVESVVAGEGRYWGSSTEKVVEFYEQAGIQVPEDSRLLPDHISVELDCLALLEQDGRHEEAADFAGSHLLKWLPGLLKHIEANAEVAFYRVWSKALQRLLKDTYE